VLFRTIRDQFEIARRRLRVGRVRTQGAGLVGLWAEERVCEEGRAVVVGSRAERVAGYGDVEIARAAAFGSDDGAVVGGRDFVDDADEAVRPARGGRGGGSIAGVGEAGFFVGDPREVEGEGEGRDLHRDSGERLDAPHAFEGLGGEVGAVG